MQVLRTALLRHETRQGAHYDWLIEDGVAPFPRHERLWTARLALPTHAWRRAGALDLTPLPPHRRDYLTYQGPVSQHRGSVRRVDQGAATCHLWRQGRILLDVAMQGYTGPIELRRTSPTHWRALLTSAV